MTNQKYIGLIGSRQLPAIYKIRIKQVIKCLLDKGYGIASGGAMGADNYVLESLLELDAAQRGIIFSAWQDYSQFPQSVIKSAKKFSALGGKIIWGDTQPFAPYKTVAVGLRSRNVRLVSRVAGLVAFIAGNSRGTIFTITQAIQRNVPVVVFCCDSYGRFPIIETGSWQPLKEKSCWENSFKFVPAQQRPVFAADRKQAAAPVLWRAATPSLPIGAAIL